jgi:AcrR family transcriptional regulator
VEEPHRRRRRPRSDGIASRVRILVAAGEVFDECGLDAPMDRVATRAGLAGATLYRHFATRELLIEALMQDRYEVLTRAIGEVRDAGGRPWEVFSQALRMTARVALANHAFIQTLTDHAYGSTVVHRLRLEFYGELAALADAAQRDGDIRADFTTGDLPLLMRAIAFQRAVADPAGALDLLERHVTLVLDALRGTTPLGPPGRDLDAAVRALLPPSG